MKENNNILPNEQSKDEMNIGHEVSKLRELAEGVANIIFDDVENVNYEETSSKLLEYYNNISTEQRYIFVHPKITGKRIAAIMLCVLCAILAYCIFIGIGTLVYSGRNNIYYVGIIITIISSGLFILMLNLLIKLISEIKFKSRYDNYIMLLGYKEFIRAEQLSVMFDLKVKRVIKDLHRAVEVKLIPYGQFISNDIFIISTAFFNRYLENNLKYDNYFEKSNNDGNSNKYQSDENTLLKETIINYKEPENLGWSRTSCN